MKKTRLAIYFDTITIWICLVLIMIVIQNSFLKNKILKLIISTTFATLISTMFYRKQMKQYLKIKNKNKDYKFYHNCINFLKFCSNFDYISYFSNLFCVKYFNDYFFINDKNCFYINIKYELTEKDFYKINEIKLSNLDKNFIIITSKTNENFLNLLKESNSKLYLYYEEDLFLFMKEKNYYPIKTSDIVQKNKFNFKSYINKTLPRKNFKNLFFSGTSLIVLSFFLPFSTTYGYFGIFLLILSIISIFIKNENNAIEKISLIDKIKENN